MSYINIKETKRCDLNFELKIHWYAEQNEKIHVPEELECNKMHYKSNQNHDKFKIKDLRLNKINLDDAAALNSQHHSER